jgi:hypothetical protein
MKTLFGCLAIAGTLLASTLGASAQYYYGPAPRYYAPPPPPYYAPPRYYRDQYYAPPPRYRQQQRYRQQCPRNWTIQDGVCKPYRGY